MNRFIVHLIALLLIVTSSSSNVPGSTIATNADNYVGTPYVWGGTDIATGVDCSGFVQTLYHQQGFGLPRTAHEQATHTEECPSVSNLSQTSIGDTVYFMNDEGHIHHVAIITGHDSDGRPIITHAKGRKYGVVKERMSDRYVSETYVIKRYSECTASFVEPKDYMLDAYIMATGVSQEQVNTSRAEDLIYIFIDPLCICNTSILALFRNHTKNIAKRTNPATDNILKTLSMNLEINDLKVKRLVNLKYANSIYSFYDLNQSNPPEELPPSTQNGCVPLNFNSQSDKDYYLQMLTQFESGGRYDAHSVNSSAYGRYQFTTSTGAQYCRKVGDDCCAYWHTASQKGMECQDKMFIEFTKDNTSFLENKGFNINTCSVYLSHQLGVGGYLWLRGGSNPYGSFLSLRNVVSNNVSGTYRDLAQLATSEAELREIYKRYWSGRFGGDIFAEVGESASLPELTQATHTLNQGKKDPTKWYREGILLELLKIIRGWEFIFESNSQKNQTEMVQ